MDLFFGAKKAAPKPAQATPNILPQKQSFNVEKRVKVLDSKCDEMETKLKTLETDIKTYYSKLKKTNLTSEKNYLKGRLKGLLMKRKQIEHQLNRYNSQRMMMDTVSFNQQNIQDTIEMGQQMKETNQIQREQLDNMDTDGILDTFEEMEEMAWEMNQINDLMNQQFDVDMDEDLEDELENLENELEVDEMMKRQQSLNDKEGYDPLKN